MKKRLLLTNIGIVPPFPEVASKNTDKNASTQDASGLVENGSDAKSAKSYPSKLLSLIRIHEKRNRDDEDYEENIDETVDLFNHLIAVYSRYGLLRGDTEKADQILSIENSAPKWGGIDSKKRGGKKGKRGKNDNKSDDLRIQQNHDGSTASETSQQLDESLIFIAILRIFTNNASADDMNKKNGVDEDQALLISLAAELCLAISQGIKLDKRSDSCNLAEYELLAQSGKGILTGLLNIMKMVENDMKVCSSRKKDTDCLTLLECNEETHVLILNSSMKLASSLVSLFGTKLSRSTALLLGLNKVAWKFLTIDEDSIQESSARLLSCLPLAGGIDRKTPSDIWSAQVQETLTNISAVLQTMAPLTQSKAKSSDDAINEFMEHWTRFVREDISNEQHRLRCFYRFTRGLTKGFKFLLLQDGLDRQFSNSSLIDAQIDITKILGVVESFVSFPLSSETVYYRTKRRLRDENVDNGLLSPKIISTEVANHVKLMGHEILDCTLATVGGPTLLPYARRILRISYASILTSSSSPVRKVMDPTSAAQLEGKKRRWLHLSVTSRAVSIATFGSAIVAFGCDYSSSSLMNSKESFTHSFIANTDCEKAITLVVGSLVEQISNDKSQNGDFDDDWGSHRERTELISAAAKCLGMTIVSCGSFLSMPIRSLIESVVVNGLSEIGGHRIQLLSWPQAKISFLQLASACVSTPWQDGASSALVDLLTTAADGLKYDIDREVSLTAMSALRICDSIAVPRAPALKYVTRAVSMASTHGNNLGLRGISTDATSLAENIEAAQKDVAVARKNLEKSELAKKRKNDEKRQREEEEKNEKALKRQKALAKKKIEKQKKLTPTTATIEELANSSKIDDDTKMKTEVNDESHSAEPNMVANRKQDHQTKVISKEEKGVTTINDTNDGEQKDNEDKVEIEGEKMEIEQEVKNGSNDDSDDEAFPEIFDGGPDSDDE